MRENYSIPPADHSFQTAGKKHEDKREQTADFLHRTSFGAQIYLHVSVRPLLVPDTKPTLSLEQQFIHS